MDCTNIFLNLYCFETCERYFTNAFAKNFVHSLTFTRAGIKHPIPWFRKILRFTFGILIATCDLSFLMGLGQMVSAVCHRMLALSSNQTFLKVPLLFLLFQPPAPTFYSLELEKTEKSLFPTL